MERADAVVVGGGISGLSAAWALARRAPGARVVVLEAGSKPGGVLTTVERDGFQCELAASSLRSPGPGVRAMLDSLGLEGDLVAASPLARRRSIYWRGALRALPAGPLGALTTGLLPARAKWRAVRESAVKSKGADGETVAAFFERRFGPAVVRPFVQALVHGIYAGDIERLEAESVFPKLVAAERAHGSVLRGMRRMRPPPEQRPVARGMFAPRGGFSSWTEALADRGGFEVRTEESLVSLERVAGEWQLETAAGSRWSTPRVHLTSWQGAVPSCAALDDRLRGLGEVDRAPIAVVGLGYATSVLPKEHDGFGFLVADTKEAEILGVLFESSVFPHRAPAGQALVRVMIGGASRDLEGDEDAQIHCARRELQRILGIAAEPVFTECKIHRPGIPQANVGHARRRAAIESALAKLPGLTAGGWQLGSIALGERVEEALRLADAHPLARSTARGAGAGRS